MFSLRFKGGIYSLLRAPTQYGSCVFLYSISYEGYLDIINKVLRLDYIV